MRRRVGESLPEFGGVGPVTIVAHAVDEKGWSAVHSTADAAAEVIANFLDVSASRQLARYALWIDPDLRRIGEKISVLQRILVVKEEIVHLPEMPLCARRLGCLCRSFGVRMRLREGKVSKNKSEGTAHVAPDTLNYRMGATAVRTFEVAVLNECHRCVGGTYRVVTVTNRYYQSC